MRFGKKTVIVSAAVMAIGTATFVSAKAPNIVPGGTAQNQQTTASTDSTKDQNNLSFAGIDMSKLTLPEGFVPFDEAHVPDGKNAPANGELKAIEFDENGKMLNGQKPAEGEKPAQTEGAEAAKEGAAESNDGRKARGGIAAQQNSVKAEDGAAAQQNGVKAQSGAAEQIDNRNAQNSSAQQKTGAAAAGAVEERDAGTSVREEYAQQNPDDGDVRGSSGQERSQDTCSPKDQGAPAPQVSAGNENAARPAEAGGPR